MVTNVCFKKTWTIYSTVSLLWFVQIFLNSALFWCFEKQLIWQIHEISYWNLPSFLSEAVEVSLCQFFENWGMKLKCPLLLKPLATIVQENSESFYSSEPFRISHFTIRHPVRRDNLQVRVISIILCDKKHEN